MFSKLFLRMEHSDSVFPVVSAPDVDPDYFNEPDDS